MKNVLSVIVPVYNVEKYLPECIESILSQTFGEIELILVDDGSIDGSGLICDQYAGLDSRVKVVHQENRGLVEARRRGLLESRGEYVTFVDGDDFVAPVSYALARESMERGTDVIIFGITRYYGGQKQVTHYNTFPEGVYSKTEIREDLASQMIWKGPEGWGIDPSLCCKIMKRDLVLSSYRKFTCGNIYFGEDAAILYPMLLEAENLEIKNVSYYYHRQRGLAYVPAYIKDDAYFDKLYTFYCHMRKVFQGDETLIRQVEYYYINSASFRKWAYEGRKLPTTRLFPFDRVERGERIAIYGAGTVGQAYKNQLDRLNFCEVVLWVDRNYEEYSQFSVHPIRTLLEAPYDKIVIAISEQSVRDAVVEELSAMGIDRAKIIV